MLACGMPTQTVAAAVKVFQNLLGGGKRAASPASASVSPPNGVRGGGGAGLGGSRGQDGLPNGAFRSIALAGGGGGRGLQTAGSSSSLSSCRSWRYISESSEGEGEGSDEEEITEAARESFRSLPFAMRAYGQRPMVLILQTPSSAALEELEAEARGGGGRDGEGGGRKMACA